MKFGQTVEVKMPSVEIHDATLIDGMEEYANLIIKSASKHLFGATFPIRAQKTMAEDGSVSLSIIGEAPDGLVNVLELILDAFKRGWWSFAFMAGLSETRTGKPADAYPDDAPERQPVTAEEDHRKALMASIDQYVAEYLAKTEVGNEG